MRGFGFVFCCKTGAMRKWYQSFNPLGFGAYVEEAAWTLCVKFSRFNPLGFGAYVEGSRCLLWQIQ